MNSQIKDRADRITPVLNLTHPCSLGSGTGWTRLVHPQELWSICPWDLKGLSLIAPKWEISAVHSWWQRKTKSNFGPSWVYEIPATFIIRGNYSSGDSWVFEAHWFASLLDEPSISMALGKQFVHGREGEEGKSGWLPVFIQKQLALRESGMLWMFCEAWRNSAEQLKSYQSCFSVIGSRTQLRL